MADSAPPHDIKAETGLLGAMLLSRDAIVAAVDVQLSGDDFYDRMHGAIFDVMVAMYGRGDLVDVVTVEQEMGLPVRPVPALLRLARSPAAARSLAQRVEELSLLRRMPGVQRQLRVMELEAQVERYRDVIAALEAELAFWRDDHRHVPKPKKRVGPYVAVFCRETPPRCGLCCSPDCRCRCHA